MAFPVINGNGHRGGRPHEGASPTITAFVRAYQALLEAVRLEGAASIGDLVDRFPSDGDAALHICALCGLVDGDGSPINLNH